MLLNASHIATPRVENITTAIAADTTPSPDSSFLGLHLSMSELADIMK